MKKIKAFQHSIHTAAIAFVLIIGIIVGCKKDDNHGEGTKNPAVESYYPNSGNEGTLVTILGKDLEGETNTVYFAGIEAKVLTRKENELVVQAPKGGKTGTISLKVADKTIEVGNYTYQALSVHNIFPFNGTEGSQIRISGTGFGNLQTTAKVNLNGKPMIIISASDTLIVAQIPKDAGSGPVKVQVANMESAGPIFVYQAIQDIKPKTGGAGTKITIKGLNFETDPTKIKADINGIPATIISLAVDNIVVVAPQGVETGPLSLTINGQRITGSDFNIVPPPTIESVSPLSAPAGTEIVVKGMNFSLLKEENKITINNKEVVATAASFSELKFILPASIGAGNLIVNVNDQTISGPKFTEQNLGITKVFPDNGLGGTEVLITGIGFSADINKNNVQFNGVTAQVLSATDTEIKVIAPTNLSTGKLTVSVNGLEALAPTSFRRAGVVTIAGGPNSSLFDFKGRNASIAVDSKGNIYLAEFANNVIKKITPNGQVSIYAGSATGQQGYSNGKRDKALFNMGYYNARLVIDKADNLYIAEQINSAIRIIRANSDDVETYVSGTQTSNIALMDNGDIYALRDNGQLFLIPKSQSSNPELKLISSNNFNESVSERRFAMGANNFMYRIRDQYDSYFQTPTGNVGSTYEYGHHDGIGANVLFNFRIGGIIRENQNELLILDGFINGAIRRFNVASKEVSTVLKFESTSLKDGTLTTAGGNTMDSDITIGNDGQIYLLDTKNKAIRKIFIK